MPDETDETAVTWWTILYEVLDHDAPDVHPLPPGERHTVELAFPKGDVHPPHMYDVLLATQPRLAGLTRDDIWVVKARAQGQGDG